MGFITINGKKVEFTNEKNILTIIRKAGIEVPTLCYQPELSIFGACRLCTVEDDGLQTLLCRISLRSDRYEPMLTLPGMAGALCADAQGCLWAATADTLYHVSITPIHIRRTIGGFGMIGSLCSGSGGVLLCDAAYDSCLLIDHHGLRCLREGDVQHGLLLGC